MKKNNNLLKIPNINSNDAKLKKLIYDVDDSLFNGDNYSKEKFEHICVCSGGTTSSCAKNGFTTLDLRKNYSKIHLDRESNLVTIGGGVIMGDLLNHLQKYNRSFPIGLSKLPGAGYILTGGVSPLSRAYGLAIDNIESIKGFLGNGTFISLKKNQLNPEKQLIWEAIKGAAPFFSIITEIELKTIQSNPIIVIEGFVKINELSEIIKLSEKFPENISLQWIYAKKIYIYVFAELKNNLENQGIEKYLMLLEKFPGLEKKIYENFNKINFFPKQLNLYELNANNHSEVISLLGEDLKNDIPNFIKCLDEIMENKPNNSCYVASQQLGCKTKKLNHGSSFFVHRKSTWKPWIYASWKKNDLQEKEVALDWIYKSWRSLKSFFPNIHLAQLHNHLNSHKEELTLAFGNRINELKTLKNIFDPQGILPPL
ncbi:FAD linked oxidase [Prochlorococcus marinus str. MIT 9107]|uniref:FAD linked oxidase n=1 Tax=Prochlorococcus marinus str. MIT 9116 TaxID=167544 RepID=A0A0A1ZUX7_PROMR|nr:FAD-binding protein [Prochlorococcus marinus]KGF90883.1 FAD linked oxidase [Prochlorococcus marinus str. MIT 9107]KGF92039.1 FAD linked oxidase [Prochlorococcus marinus str. MIT 9116]KGF93419.1 FAD linked oxidase [Prochlorococcus marinus str. MIT 9123]